MAQHGPVAGCEGPRPAGWPTALVHLPCAPSQSTGAPPTLNRTVPCACEESRLRIQPGCSQEGVGTKGRAVGLGGQQQPLCETLVLLGVT